MGIDIEIYIRTEPTDDAIGKIRALSKARTEDGDCKYPVIDSVFRGEGCVRVSSCMRYFGKYYLRGCWPAIKKSLLAIRDVCPQPSSLLSLPYSIVCPVEMLAIRLHAKRFDKVLLCRLCNRLQPL